jgi:gluconolactonase
MKRKRISIGLCVLLAGLPAFLPSSQVGQAQTKAPEKAQPPLPKATGEMLVFSFDQSKIFPGTTREVKVYVPKDYDGKTPACVHVNQDGVQFNAPQVFDQLIAEKAMPMTIGVFVMHGQVKPAKPDEALSRFNRSYEYDGLGDGYAKFLLEEILPYVETLKTPSGKGIVLSKSGNDRSIGGTSSGAIAAFTAAWERPDAFTRVFSGIGTYVGLRGGHNYPTLIRKFEPKPIRIFLEDGTNDLNIYGGDWWIANQAMERSFTFAGYEVSHKWGEGGHNNKHATECFPDGMRFLWKDWPKPVAVGKGNPDLQALLIPGENWKLVGEGYKFTEGPCTSPTGEVYFNDGGNSKTYKIVDGKPVEFLSNSNRGDGQRFGPDGSLYAVSAGLEKIVKYDAAGKMTEVASGFKGNDLVVLKNGGIYVTHPGWDGKTPSEVIFISPTGEKKVVDKGLKFSNGICTSPDQTLLYVADSRTHWVYSYQIQPDGTLKHKQKYYHLHVRDTEDESGADGMRVDTEGTLYIATRYGIQFADQPGRVHGIMPTPNGKLSNLTFGGPKKDILYVTAGDKVYSRQIKKTGYDSFQEPIKPKQPGL